MTQANPSHQVTKRRVLRFPLWVLLGVLLGLCILTYWWTFQGGYSRRFRGIEMQVVEGTLVGLTRADLVERFGEPFKPKGPNARHGYTTAQGPVSLAANQTLWLAGNTDDGSWPIFLVVSFDERDMVTLAELSQPDESLYRIPGPHNAK
jgi:hypothetical protein